jgi:thiol:disulfide interchange protein DsbD
LVWKSDALSRAAVVAMCVLSSGLTVFGQGSGSERVVKAQGYASVDAVRPGDKFKIAISLQITDGYHVNAHVPSMDGLVGTAVSIQGPAEITVKDPVYPAAEEHSFDFAPDTKLSVYQGTVVVIAEAQASNRLQPGTASINAKVTVQSCSNSQCLTPATLDVSIPINVVKAGAKTSPLNGEVFSGATSTSGTTGAGPAGSPTSKPPSSGPKKRPNQIEGWIAKYGLPVTLVIVFLIGIALNGTPCVYPIIPITISFFANQGGGQGSPRLRRTFGMACMYVLGMALTYSVLGVVAALTGSLFGEALQKPAVLIGLAVLMVALSLSMFGLYEFRMPESLNRFATTSTQSTTGFVGALVMGLTMGIVAAPCVGPFVVALIAHVADKGDPVYGFALFFILALGLGAPYLILGTFSGALQKLPRSGLWMVAVRKVFGVILIGMAIYFLLPLLGGYSTPVLVVFFVAAAAYLILWESGRTKPKQFGWVLRVIGAGALAAGVFFVLPKKVAAISWQPYSEQAVADAAKAGKGVIIDTYADWCIPCRYLDNSTFKDLAVNKEAERFVMIKLDMTSTKNMSPDELAATKRFEIKGAPTIIFLDGSGQEQEDLRLNEFEKPDEFLARMKQVESGATVAKKGDAAPPPTTGAEPGTAAASLPNVPVKLLSGKPLDLQAEKGKVLVLDFWATWCVPCMSEIPTFNQLNKAYKDRGVEVVAAATDKEGADKVAPFTKQHHMDYTIATVDEAAAKAFGVGEALPVTLVIDKQGKIRFTHTNVNEKDKLAGEIEQLLKEG